MTLIQISIPEVTLRIHSSFRKRADKWIKSPFISSLFKIYQKIFYKAAAPLMA